MQYKLQHNKGGPIIYLLLVHLASKSSSVVHSAIL